jgi:ABC-type Mn2+/Zn2+ transport system ATPase subunit
MEAHFAIVGPNGAGKTVLVKAIIGALPYQGSIRWEESTRIGDVPQKLDIEWDLPITSGDFLRAKAVVSNRSSLKLRSSPTSVSRRLLVALISLRSCSSAALLRL